MANLTQQICDAAEAGNCTSLLSLLREDRGNTASATEGLRWAAVKGRTQAVKMLLDHGADVHADGGALRWAAGNGHTPVVKLLLERGAVVDLNAIARANANGHPETAAILKAHLDASRNAPHDEFKDAIQGLAGAMAAHTKSLTEVNCWFEKLTALLHKNPHLTLPPDIVAAAKSHTGEASRELIETQALAAEIRVEQLQDRTDIVR